MRTRYSLLLVTSLLVCNLGAAADTVPAHLKLARKMVADVKPENNRYKNGKYTVTWAGVGDSKITQNESDCTTFITALLHTAYGWKADDFKAFAGVASPSISKYYDAAVADKTLKGYKAIKDVKPGDLIISKYAKGESGSAAGHLMIVDEAPKSTGTADGMRKFAITIIDVSAAPHADDTRQAKNSPNGEKLTGAGRGTMQVYVDNKGDVVEWSWSAGNRMIRYSADKRPIIFAKIPTR